MFDEIFQLRIGIYYINRQWALDIFENIIKNIPKVYIKYIHKKDDYIECILENGSCIKCIRANENCRGQRFDKAIIEPGIEWEVFSSIIMPAVSFRRITEFIAYDIGGGYDIGDAKTYYYKLSKEEEEFNNVLKQ